MRCVVTHPKFLFVSLALVSILPCPAQPRLVDIVPDKGVGGLWCDAYGLPEYSEQVFQVNFQVPDGCEVEFAWSFDGAGAQVVEGHGTAAPRVRFDRTGVCDIEMRARIVTQGCEPREWFGRTIYFVIGGPFDVTLVNAVPNYSNDYHRDYLPWYLTFHGFDPASTGGALPRNLQPPAYAVIRARYEQPRGERYRTVYEWEYPAGSMWMQNAAQNGTEHAREARFYARTGSQRGGLEVKLRYALIYDDVRLGDAYDNSHLVLRESNARENYRKFTAHMPKGTDFVAAVPPLEQTTLLSPPPPAPPPYYNSRYYMYRLRDHLGFWMPGTWVQERFPNGVPPGFETNSWLTPWITRWNRPWNGVEVGRFGDARSEDKADWIRAAVPAWWPIIEHPHNPFQFPNYAYDRVRQHYVAGSRDTRVNAPGGLVGERDIMFWSDQIWHIPQRWPAWDWPPDPPEPPPPPPWPP